MLLISADSHVVEPPDLWVKNLPSSMRDRAPTYDPIGHDNVFQAHAGGHDPHARLKEMLVDGVSGEILYASNVLDQYSMTDAVLQEACFSIYNDWLIDYCSVALDRLYGIGAISLYRIDNAIKELRRCKAAGLRGVMIWQIPPAELAFDTLHYEKFWDAVEDAEMPVSLHILCGMPYKLGWTKEKRTPTQLIRLAVNQKLLYAANTLSDLIVSGVVERHPKLKFVFVENEVSWMPFVLSQADKYCARGITKGILTLTPSEYMQRNFYGTFFNDPPTRWLFNNWGVTNSMWSNDYPHPNSTWPKSSEVIARDLGALPEETRMRLLHGNVMDLYGIEVPEIAAA